ncbi:MAG TPA: efflux RND transporter permease subunit [Rhizomicrobium sp.]|jgi:multidrug efflux pump|nr:efflux RND transporter permease subunit [Rhizomicrobium sp.]
MLLSRFFIDRPVFAWVIAIVIMLAGGIAAFSLPVEQYPTIAPPAVVINATYPGADATTLQNSVTQVIEQQLTGLDNLLYFSSASNANGTVAITVTFAPGTNPDIAQVQVQNKVQQAVAQLPAQVQQLGVTVAKAQANFLVVFALYDESNGRYTSQDVSDFMVSKVADSLGRAPGVATSLIFGAPYAMRIWLDPYKLHDYSLEPSDVRNAILAQNTQVSAGSIGGLPSVPGQALNATVTAQSQLQTPQQFRNIVLRTTTGGAVVHLSDVARVELGADNYAISGRMNGMPASGIAITPAPSANALQLVDELKRRAAALEPSLPPGMKIVLALDNTEFIRLSIKDVVETLIEAIGLVILVMYIFLQNWRTTLVPAVAVPVVLLGTFGVLAATGYSINLLTLFALVLVIGLLVDDAIVVVENVERIMREEGLLPRDATLRSMQEITGALIGIGLVLTAVFLPMAFFGGSTGIIYRQFSVTIVSAMLLSIMCALVLTPALCATLLKPIEGGEHRHGAGLLGRFFHWFNRSFEDARTWYRRNLERVLSHTKSVMLAYALVLVALGGLFFYLPTGFLPDEDQGFLFNLVSLPSGTTLQKTQRVAEGAMNHFLKDEKNNSEFVFAISGFSFLGVGQNTGIVFVRLKDWAERPGAKNTSAAIARRATVLFRRNPDARIIPVLPPAVRELGNSTGFDLEMEDRGNLGHDKLIAARNQLLAMAARNPKLATVRPASLDDTQQIHINVDQEKANAFGVSTSDLNATLSAAWGGTFVNNFIDRDRVKRVYIQGDAPFRMAPEDLNRWYVRSAGGGMAPFSSFTNVSWLMGPTSLTRYNGVPALEIQGAGASGISSGTALAEMDKLFKKLPQGIGYELTGLSYQEEQSGAQAPALYGLSILIIYLCLAALYESWAIPLSVMLVIPLGVIGALLAATLRGLFNDIYFQVGLLTTIGLSAKNAILIVEFAVEAEKNGMTARQAALEAARLRLRPILMTSIAFIAGVFPLAVATGAGAGSQNDIGTGVIGGMITATVLAIFFVPVFFQLINRGLQHHE